MTLIFTTLRVRDGVPWFGADHGQRLGLEEERAGELLEEIRRAVRDHPDDRVRTDARVRITGAAPPRIEIAPYDPPVVPWRVRPVAVSPDGDRVRSKTTDRAMYDEARKRAAGADEALLHLADGTLLEGTVCNVFFAFGARLATPPSDLPLLAGIARKRVLEAAGGVGLRVEETPVDLVSAERADACVVTNALMIAHPVREIDGVGTYQSVELARRLKEAVVPDSPQSV